ncbi:hybrid sensor histidine kinase/response regulator [uncultured Thiodictyon sp.]|uniref:Hpt domain-containing response regulator n=1 Tax=uncultured Thiodictyon sp. TaxID=1846217 RepID=UPI0025D62096|nr:hybrid sensor histidine kinase/response regulator [uncultured Thiodictyon sp.]
MNPFDARHRILLVADSPAIRGLVGEILGAAGYALDAVPDGPQAVQRAAADRYALVLTALSLPGLDGMAATHAIRRLPYPQGDVPILAITATVSVMDRDRCFAAGIDGFLTTPIDRLDLLEAVAQWLEAADDPTWGLDARPGVAPPLVNRRTLAQLEEDVGPELLPEILTTFLQETERRLALLEARVLAGDALGAADEAHALKGSSGTFGAMALRQAVHEMELSGRAGEGVRLGELMPEVRRLVTVTCDLLRAEYASPDPDRLVP